MRLGHEKDGDFMDANSGMVNPKPVPPIRNGGFDDCAVSGQQFEDQKGTKFWKITIVSADNFRPVAKRVNVQCVVSGEEFRCVKVETAIPSFEVRPVETTDINEDIKQGALGVIRKWESESRIS